MRKHTFLVIASACICLAALSQDLRQHNSRMIAFGQMPEVEKTETVQSRFRDQKWSPGNVQLASGQLMQVPLIFDQYNNMLYFLQGTRIMEFAQKVDAFTMDLIERNDTIQLLFRNNYPAVGYNTANTYYEVMVDGPVQLLRCKSKSIYLEKDQNLPEDRRDYKKELIYAYTPEKQMILLRRDKDDIARQLPAFARIVQTVTQEHKIALKRDQGMQELFFRINEAIADK